MPRERVIAEHIEATPGVCGGKPRIAGHRIRVQDIVVEHEVHGLCPEEVVDAFPTINLADVHAALACYHDHRDEIRQDMADDRAFVADVKKKYPPQPDLTTGHGSGAGIAIPPG